MKIIISAGGTGGHFFSGIAVGEELLQRGYSVYLLTDQRCFKYITKDNKIPYKILSFQISTNKIKNLLALVYCFAKSWWFLYKNKPQIIVGFGGYPTFPHLLAAIILRIPIIIHEQNCFLGKTNRFFAKFASKIACSYKSDKHDLSNSSKFIFTGDIIRNNIRALPKKQFGGTNNFHLLVFGGSQGAAIFAKIIPESLAKVVQVFPKVKFSITQQASLLEQVKLAKIYHDLDINSNLAEFFHNMPENYTKADLAITRSGASTIAELCCACLPAIFIPYPYAAENHQFYNAKALCDISAGWLIAQNDLTAQILAEKIIAIINDQNCLSAAAKIMSERQNNGHKIVADTVEKIIKQV